MFLAATRQRSSDLAVVVKSANDDPLQLVPAVRAQVAAIDPAQPIHGIAPMTQVLFDDLATTYVLTAILSTIGVIALVLSVTGIYGLVSYSVAQRRREIGVRLALGAGPAAVIRLIVMQSTSPVAIGCVIGLGAAAAMSLIIAAGVPEIDPRDPVSYGGVVLLIVASALLATIVPARRAASIKPVDALRSD